MRMTSMTPGAGVVPYAAAPPSVSPASLLDRAFGGPAFSSEWPAYDLEALGPDRYRLVLAAPGYAIDELEIVSEPNRLTVSGQPKDQGDEAQVVYRGIVRAPFKRSYELADHVRVESARLENGLLAIELVREIPEALRPRRIEIASDKGGPGRASPDGAQTH